MNERTFKNAEQKTALIDMRKNGVKAGDRVLVSAQGRHAYSTVINTPDHDYLYNAASQFVGRVPCCVEVDSDNFGYLYWKSIDAHAELRVVLDDDTFVLYPRDKADAQFEAIEANTQKFGFNAYAEEVVVEQVRDCDFCDFCGKYDREEVLPLATEHGTINVCDACEQVFDAIVVHEAEEVFDLEVAAQIKILTPADDKYFAAFAPKLDLTSLYAVTWPRFEDSDEPFCVVSHISEPRGVDHAIELTGEEAAGLILWFVRNKVVHHVETYKRRQGVVVNEDGFVDRSSRRFVELYVERANAI